MIRENTRQTRCTSETNLQLRQTFSFKGNATFTFISSSSHIFFSGCVPVSSSSPWTPEGMIRLYPLSWSEWGRPESKLHTLRQPDDICDPSTGRRDRRPVWTCKHTETHFSVRFLTANGTYSEVWLLGGQKVDSDPICEQTAVWTERFTKCSYDTTQRETVWKWTSWQSSFLMKVS